MRRIASSARNCSGALPLSRWYCSPTPSSGTPRALRSFAIASTAPNFAFGKSAAGLVVEELRRSGSASRAARSASSIQSSPITRCHRQSRRAPLLANASLTTSQAGTRPSKWSITVVMWSRITATSCVARPRAARAAIAAARLSSHQISVVPCIGLPFATRPVDHPVPEREVVAGPATGCSSASLSADSGRHRVVAADARRGRPGTRGRPSSGPCRAAPGRCGATPARRAAAGPRGWRRGPARRRKVATARSG